MRVILRAGSLIACLFLFSTVSRGQVFDNQCPSTQSSIVPLRTVNITNGHFNDTTCVDVNGNLIFQALNPSLSASDTFTRANGTLGPNWTIPVGAFNITSNAAQPVTTTISSAFWSGTNLVSNSQFSQVTIAAIGGGFPGASVFISNAGDTRYTCFESTTTIIIQRRLAGVLNNLISAGTTGVSGDVLRLEINSSGNLTCYKNGVSTLTVTDTNIKSGSPGIHSDNTTSTLSNWSGGNMPVSAGTGPTLNSPITTVVNGVQNITSTFSRGGTDIGDEINKAYLSCPASGCRINIFPKPDNTCYNFTTAINFNVLNKPVKIVGMSPGNLNAGSATCLNWTTTSASTAINVDWGMIAGNTTYTSGFGFFNIRLTNALCVTNGGCGNSATGIQVGQTNAGARGLEFEDMDLMGFGTGLLYAAGDSTGIGWGTHWDRGSIAFNTIGVQYNSPHENDSYIETKIITNGTGISFNNSGNTEITLISGSVDSQTTCGLSNVTGLAYIHTYGVHWENLGQTNLQYTCDTPLGMFLDIFGGRVTDDTSGTTSAQNWFSAAQIEVHGLNIFGGLGGRTYTGKVFNCGDNCHVQVHNAAPTALTISNICATGLGNPCYLENLTQGVLPSSTMPWPLTTSKYSTQGNCTSSASPAVCAAAPAGVFVLAAAATTVTVNTTAVTANSEIIIMNDDSLGGRLSVTCNTTLDQVFVSGRVAATSFTITGTAPVTNPNCYSYLIIN